MTGKRKPRGPYRKGIERREQILDTALEVFSQHGDRGSSLQEIADRVGLTQAGVLHYFGSREELLLAILKRRDKLDSQVGEDVRSPGEAVTRTVRHNMEQSGLVKLFVALSAAAATDPVHHAHGYFADRYRELTGQIVRGLEQGQHSGQVRKDVQADHMARLLLAVSDGLQLQWLMDPSVDMVALVETFNQMCLAWAGPAEAEPAR
ncbi:TetR/AcrR family transcriptional regulator [Actinomadura rudentiformis]|uniref:TetR/AcrR family transcriptional regulator n=1 Tax=Actinomadura rudentiformis TaxID=359158 RepID=A0A6H9YAF9_9ACTN|nr:TetR/AcrR family transcriptional regulator [Actinomadura rudentiformis]KAB2341608.1 TetR/AcrR family transcriptional regulator [Actinomadura rudentiformis]